MDLDLGKRSRYLHQVIPISILIVTALSILTLHSNPTPVPTLIMSAEYIDIHVDAEKGLVYVHGKYPFDSVGRVENVVMYFPIPNSSINVAVYMNGKPIS